MRSSVVRVLHGRPVSFGAFDPDVDDAIILWVSYPHWQRCSELFDFLRIVTCCVVRRQHVADFVDIGTTSLTPGQMLSSFNLVRSWAKFGLAGGGQTTATDWMTKCLCVQCFKR